MRSVSGEPMPSFTHTDSIACHCERVSRGESVIDDTLIGRLLGHQQQLSRLNDLTERERLVLQHMAEGRSNTAIADQLVISDRAVEKHISNIFSKLGLPPSDSDHRRVLAVLAYLGS